MSCDIDIELQPSMKCFGSEATVLLVSKRSAVYYINNPLLKVLSMSFWAEAELPHLLVTELIQVSVHL